MSKTIKYALRHKKSGNLLVCLFSSNEGRDSCVDYTITLYDDDSGAVWQVDTKEQAEYVRQYSTEWYNADHDTPSHEFKANQLEIVELVTEIRTVKNKIKIPTIQEYWRWQFGKGGPQEDSKRLKYLLGLKGHLQSPTWYEVREWIEAHKNRKKSQMENSQITIGSEWRSPKNKYSYTILDVFKNKDQVEVRGSDGVVRRINTCKLKNDYYLVPNK